MEVEPSSRSLEQLEAIASLDGVLDGAEIDYWLFGGWAVDFWVGRVTREHDDIDAAAWRRDYDAIKHELIAHGWRHAPAADEVVGTRYALGNVDVEFTFIDQRDDGAVVIPIPGQEIVWTHEPLGNARPSLGRATARAIPLDLLRDGKTSFARTTVAEAAKDRADAAALADL